MTGARAGAGFGGQGYGWVAGRAGLWGVLPGFGVVVPAPRPLGTQPPFAT